MTSRAMTRPLRNTDPGAIRLITSRTECAALFMVPGEELNEIIGGILARFQEKYGVEIFGLTILSNHFHILCRSPLRNTCFFFQEVKKEIALKVNRLIGREGHFWHRRYDDQACQTEGDSMEALLYIVTNPVKHQLVDRVQNWPGLNSYQQMLDGKPRAYEFVSYTKKAAELKLATSENRLPKPEAYTTRHELKISPLPSLEKLLQGKTFAQLVDERVAELRQRQNNARVLGRKKILRQSPFSVPENVSRTPRPMCYTKCLEAMKIFRQTYNAWSAAYFEASKKFRRGFLDAIFPPESMKPPLLYMIPA